jgi:hypothetical protein
LTRASGDGKWGVMHDSYFLAEGSDEKLTALFAKLERDYGKPTFDGKTGKLKPISDRPLPAETIKELARLLQPNEVKNDK